MLYTNGITEASRCLPRVVNPGSIFARVSSVLTTSSLFIYNCRHLSIKFWTCKSCLNIWSKRKRNKLGQISFCRLSLWNSIHKIHNKASGKVENYRKLVKCFANNGYPYKFNILPWNFFAIIAWGRCRTWVCHRNISCVIVWWFTLGLIRSLSWWS